MVTTPQVPPECGNAAARHTFRLDVCNLRQTLSGQPGPDRAHGRESHRMGGLPFGARGGCGHRRLHFVRGHVPGWADRSFRARPPFPHCRFHRAVLVPVEPAVPSFESILFPPVRRPVPCYELFGDKLNAILDDLNARLAA